MRRKIELIILVCVLGVMWVNVAMLGRDLKVRMVYGGGGTECGTGCICSNTLSTPLTCRGYAHCDTVNDGDGSWDYVYIDNLGTCDPEMGNYSFEQYCDWPCGGVEEDGGTCESLSQPSCGGGTCPNGKTCVGVGSQGLCGCSNSPSGGAG